MKKSFVEPLEKKVFSEIRKNGLVKRDFLLCVSGGKDSLTLLHVFLKLRDQFGISFRVAHVIHDSSDAFTNKKKNSQQKFRYQAYKSLLKYSQELNFKLLSNIHIKSLKITPALSEKNPSEETLRNFRYACILKYKKPEEVIVLGHHMNDLLETRILRLIRGTGIVGATSMKVWDEHLFRPLLRLSVHEIYEYLNKKRIPFAEDPSNQSNKILRNWVRNKWLSDLEKKRPGSMRAMARSLDQLSDVFLQHSSAHLEALMPQGVSRQKLIELNYEQKMQVFASYLGQLKRSGYTRAHIEEILKRLDTSQKVITFKTAGLYWYVDAEFIKARPTVSSL